MCDEGACVISLRSPTTTKPPITKSPNVDENENQVTAAFFPPDKQIPTTDDWIPHEYDKLVYLMRKAGLIQDNRMAHSRRILKNSFKGEDFVRWVMQERNLKRGEALSAGQKILERYFPASQKHSSFSSDRYYQLAEDDQSLPLNVCPSNAPSTSTNTPANNTLNVGDYNDQLCQIIGPMFDQILSENKRCIYYDLLEDNAAFQHYLSFIKKAIHLDIEGASVPEKLAFFTNVFNTMLLHVVYKYGLATNIWQKRKYQNSIYYQLGQHSYSLQSIFNGILRGNKKGLDMLWAPFGEEDPRNRFVISDGEPLAHFAINNCTITCPPIRVYSSKNVYAEMKENARKCFQSSDFLSIDRKKKSIVLARFFRWYTNDFGPNQQDIIKWIVELFPDKLECKRSLMEMFYTGEYSIVYLSSNLESNMLQACIKF